MQQLIASVTGLQLSQLDEGANWFALGLDSLVIVQIQQAVMKHFGIEFELATLMGALDTCQKLAEKIGELVPEEALPAEAINEQIISDSAPIQMTNDNTLSATTGSATTSAAGSLESLCQQQMVAMNQLFQSQLSAFSGQISSGSRAENITPSVPETHQQAPHPKVNQPRKEIKGLYQSLKTEKNNALSRQQLAHLSWLQQQLNQRTSASKAYTAQHRTHYANSRSILGFKPETKEMTYPVHVDKAEGIYLWDMDGNRYIDITMGFGSILFTTIRISLKIRYQRCLRWAPRSARRIFRPQLRLKSCAV